MDRAWVDVASLQASTAVCVTPLMLRSAHDVLMPGQTQPMSGRRRESHRPLARQEPCCRTTRRPCDTCCWSALLRAQQPNRGRTRRSTRRDGASNATTPAAESVVSWNHAVTGRSSCSGLSCHRVVARVKTIMMQDPSPSHGLVHWTALSCDTPAAQPRGPSNATKATSVPESLREVPFPLLHRAGAAPTRTALLPLPAFRPGFDPEARRG